MVVADEDPPARKRSRLSLKSKKGDSTAAMEEAPVLDTASMTPQGPSIKSEEEATDCSPPVLDLTESDLPCEGLGVPPVASMENLGNTCFLNSVLEVLRYTPCFLEGLEELYRHIVYLEKLKASDVFQQHSEEDEEMKKKPSLAWDLVKNMFKMYKRMEKREEMFGQFANADVTSMAVKPDKVLDVIREFNPMFEGHMQHDAQEVLRCVLCYLEDSERELHSDYASILALQPSLLKTPGPGSVSGSGSVCGSSAAAPSTVTSASLQEAEKAASTTTTTTTTTNKNPIMDKFLAAGKSKLRRTRGRGLATRVLKFEQPSSSSSSSSTASSSSEAQRNSSQNGGGEGNINGSSCNGSLSSSSSSFNKHASPRSGGGNRPRDFLDEIDAEYKEENVTLTTHPPPSESRKRRFRPTRLRKVSEEANDEFDEVDCMKREKTAANNEDTDTSLPEKVPTSPPPLRSPKKEKGASEEDIGVGGVGKRVRNSLSPPPPGTSAVVKKELVNGVGSEGEGEREPNVVVRRSARTRVSNSSKRALLRDCTPTSNREVRGKRSCHSGSSSSSSGSNSNSNAQVKAVKEEQIDASDSQASSSLLSDESTMKTKSLSPSSRDWQQASSCSERTMVNGNHDMSDEEQEDGGKGEGVSVDKSQPTILAMFGKRGGGSGGGGGGEVGRSRTGRGGGRGQCRRLGMRGRSRVVQQQQHPHPTSPSFTPSTSTSSLISPPMSPESPPEQQQQLQQQQLQQQSPPPEVRRSPRKPLNNTRPVSVTASSPRKHNGFMTPSSSPARPDEFPAHAVTTNRNAGGGVDSATTSLGGGSSSGCVTASVDIVNASSAQIVHNHETATSTSSASVLGVNDVDNIDNDDGNDDEDDDDNPSPTITYSPKTEHRKTTAATTTHDDITDDTDSTEPDYLPDIPPLSPPHSTQGSSVDSLPLLKQGVTSPVKSRLEKMLASKKGKKASSNMSSSSVSPTFDGGVSGMGSPPVSPPTSKWEPSLTPQPKSSKMVLKLEKCDHLCSTPTISASAAIKALKVTKGPCRKMMFDDDDDTNTNDHDSDEDESSLGIKSSFKSVPLKSVCVKVEKCDTVCDSPEKWVSARLATSTLARQRAQRFNIIEKLFQGTMVNRTKCLECERCTERKEHFQDVSVPLTAEGSDGSDSESEREKDSSLLRLMAAFTDVEHLNGDNKYYCEQCLHYVEAQRSLHYEALPNILTVHLKRFSATGMFGCLSKINDYVTVPLTLSCLHYKCPRLCNRPDHRYTLYGIITHAGSTISAGHYLSYIKVRPNALGTESLSPYLNTPSSKLGTPHTTRNIFESPSTPQHSSKEEETTTSNSGSPTKLAQPTERGDYLPQPSSPSPSSKAWNGSEGGGGGDMNGGMQTPPRTGGGDGGGGVKSDRGISSLTTSSSASALAEYHWLECDDETIRILTEKEFHGRLLEREGALRGTPYVLFYHRLDTWNAK